MLIFNIFLLFWLLHIAILPYEFILTSNSCELFVAYFVLPGQGENSIETVIDLSMYFMLKIEDGRGKHAFIGFGFAERNEAFDFNMALSDHEKYVRREHEKESGESSENDTHIDIHPAVNHRLKACSFESAKIIYHLGILCFSYFV